MIKSDTLHSLLCLHIYLGLQLIPAGYKSNLSAPGCAALLPDSKWAICSRVFVGNCRWNSASKGTPSTAGKADWKQEKKKKRMSKDVVVLSGF